MNVPLSLPPGEEDIDRDMRYIARNLAMGLYDISKILTMCNVPAYKFHSWKDNPRFQSYLKTETEAWSSAHNTAERTKLKAAIMMEEFLPTAFAEMTNGKQGLNHRTELAKLITKIGGLEPANNGFGASGAGGGGGFSLAINITPSKVVTISAHQEVDEAEVVDVQPMRKVKAPQAIPEYMPELDFDMEDDSALFSSPDTLEGL